MRRLRAAGGTAIAHWDVLIDNDATAARARTHIKRLPREFSFGSARIAL